MKQPSLTIKLNLVSFFYVGSLFFYGMGLYFPILSSKTSFLIFTIEKQSLRLTDSIEYFWDKEDIFLAMVILTFTIVFPVVKYFDLGIRLFLPKILPRRLVQILKDLDKWSMLDVFLVALLILNFKLDTSMVSMELQPGTTYIAISVVLRMLASHFIDKSYIPRISD